MNRIKELRNKAELSQERLAAMAGITTMTVRNAEAGRNVQVTTMKAIADALGVAFTELFVAPEQHLDGERAS